jgi:hypothetical protein
MVPITYVGVTPAELSTLVGGEKWREWRCSSSSIVKLRERDPTRNVNAVLPVDSRSFGAASVRRVMTAHTSVTTLIPERNRRVRSRFPNALSEVMLSPDNN